MPRIVFEKTSGQKHPYLKIFEKINGDENIQAILKFTDERSRDYYYEFAMEVLEVNNVDYKELIPEKSFEVRFNNWTEWDKIVSSLILYFVATYGANKQPKLEEFTVFYRFIDLNTVTYWYTRLLRVNLKPTSKERDRSLKSLGYLLYRTEFEVAPPWVLYLKE